MTRIVINHMLLSHHGGTERYRCLVVPLRQRSYFICARCAGAFAGLVCGLPLTWLDSALISPWILFLALPDWIASSLLAYRGPNTIRIASGFIIGLVYAHNLNELLHLRICPDLWIVNGLAIAIYLATVWLTLRKHQANQQNSTRNHHFHHTPRPGEPFGQH